MNMVKGVIKSIKSCGGINSVEVSIDGKYKFTADTMELKDEFREGSEVILLFKEFDVIISKSKNLLLSVENQFDCTVEEINSGEIFTEIKLRSLFGGITSIISSESCRRLNLQRDCAVICCIKATEISFAELKQ